MPGKKKIDEMRTEIITENEILEKVIRRPAPTRWKAFILFLWFTGVRRNEAIAISTDDISIDGDFLRIRIYTLKKRRKSEMDRIRINYIPLKHPLAKPVIQHLIKILQLSKKKGKPLKLFPWKHDTAWRIVKHFDPSWYPHLFRHTRAVLLAQNPRITVWSHAYWFGWDDLRMSMRYFKMVGRFTKEIAIAAWEETKEEKMEESDLKDALK